MSVDPAEWHSFGDPVPSQEATVAKPPAAKTGRRWHSPQTAWLAVGGTIMSAIVGIAVFFTAVAVSGNQGGDVVIAARPSEGPAGQSREPGETHAAGVGADSLVVDVEGAVARPGVYRVPAGARVGDAIAAAGGYAPGVDLGAAALALNLAQPLQDGAKVRVPLIGDIGTAIDGGPGASGVAPGSGGGAGGLVDLNHADQAALEGLTGIGPATAAKIIAARTESPFASLDDAVARKAISASLLDKIRDQVTVTP